MAEQIVRLYIAEFEKCGVWMRDGPSHFKKYIKPYDMYVIYQLGRERLPIGSERFLKLFGEMGEQCKVIDAREMKDEDLYAHMLEQIETYSTRDTYVLFLGCQKEHDAIRGKFSCYKSVVESDTFYYSRITLPFGTAGASSEKQVREKGPADKNTKGKKNPPRKNAKQEAIPSPIETTLVEEDSSEVSPPKEQKTKDPGEEEKKGNSVPFFGIAKGEKAGKETALPASSNKGKAHGGKPGKGKPWAKPENRKEDRGGKQGKKTKKNKPQDEAEVNADKSKPTAGKNKSKERDLSPVPDTAPSEDEKEGKKGKEQKKPQMGGITTTDDFAFALGNLTVGDQPSPGSGRPVIRGDKPSEREEPAKEAPMQSPDEKPAQEFQKKAGEEAAESPSAASQKKWEQRISRDPKRKDESSREWQERQALEKAIFGVQYSSEMPERVYSELDDSKALTVSLIADRLLMNINRMVPSVKKQNFAYDDYMEFVATLVKSENFEDFMEGWMTISGSRLPVDRKEMEEAYPGLRREAQYYAKTCNILYGEDGW